MRNRLFAFLVLFFVVCCYGDETREIRLDELDISKMTSGWNEPKANKSIEGRPISIGGRKFEHGVGTHSESMFAVSLDGKARRFEAFVGVDDEAANNQGSVEFRIYGDHKLLYESVIMKGMDAAKEVDVDISGVKKLLLVVGNGGDDSNHDHADWADAKIVYDGEKPVAADALNSQPYILTPKASGSPKIKGPKVFGVRPGSPFLYTIPATGQQPMEFSVEGLPSGLSVDKQKGIITGKLEKSGEYKVVLAAKNNLATDKKGFKIVVGDNLSLTPPMGWNSWNCWGCAVTAEHIKAAADAMASSGLINHGWTYINIDDCWHGRRDPNTGVINSNEKFPDMKALCEYVHSRGLRIGLYTDCGLKTCAGYEGSEGHELSDMMRYAEWGFDYVKIDWCYCENKDPNKTYKSFGDALKQVPRDIIFSICNWGQNEPWKWGAKVGGQCWRTTGDIEDTWESMSRIGFGQAGLSEYAGPGHWNDPDMLVVGYVGWGPQVRPTKLTPDEQYTHISLWCLLSSPLLLGCDMTKLDDFTLNLITNDEVLAISQDTLGRQADRISKNGDREVWAKELEDGSMAVGLFNRGLFEDKVSVSWEKLGLKGPQKVHDLWRQKDIGVFSKELEVNVPAHGVVLVRIAE